MLNLTAALAVVLPFVPGQSNHGLVHHSVVDKANCILGQLAQGTFAVLLRPRVTDLCALLG